MSVVMMTPGHTMVPSPISTFGPTDASGWTAVYPRTDLTGAYNFVWMASIGDVTRYATRSVFIGAAGTQGGSVQSVDGQYVRWDRGALYGLRAGLAIRVLRNGEQIATGRVIDVRRDDCDVAPSKVRALPFLT